jgi:hypothetical protein
MNRLITGDRHLKHRGLRPLVSLSLTDDSATWM